MSEKIDKYEGCLVGGAIGDALGGPVEFMSESTIARHYPKGVRQFESMGRDWPEGTVTDDTQMTMFGCEGILETPAGYAVAPTVYEAYRRWYRTQTERYDRSEANSLRLLGIPELWKSRCPGTTCMGSLASGKPVKRGTCGGVMRSAPFGLQDKSPVSCFEDAKDCAAMTHGVPDGWLPAGGLAMIVRCLVQGESLESAVKRTLLKLAKTEGPTRMLLRKALQMGQTVKAERAVGMVDFGTMQRRTHLLGSGFDGPAALAIAVYAALAAEGDFLTTVSLAVTHGGDSDSTGAIAGNIAGAMLGVGGLPADLACEVEFGDVLSYFAHALAERKVEVPA